MEEKWFKDSVNFDRQTLQIAVAGVITSFSPNNHPRNLDKIMDYVQKYCYEHADSGCTMSDGFYTYWNITDIRKWMHDMLMGCLEYRQLNISQRLWDEGVRDCDDERNGGFGFCFVGHKDDGGIVLGDMPDYNNFVDLDACSDMIAHVVGQITN